MMFEYMLLSIRTHFLKRQQFKIQNERLRHHDGSVHGPEAVKQEKGELNHFIPKGNLKILKSFKFVVTRWLYRFFNPIHSHFTGTLGLKLFMVKI
jgi:hypothetical protein